MPVQGAIVYINDHAITRTDIQGRFIMSSKKREVFSIRLEKPGYEKVQAEFTFDPMDAMHFTMVNARQLISRAEKAMDERRFADAIRFLDRSLAFENTDPNALYLKALALVQLKQYDSARNVLWELETRVGPKDYINAVREKLGDG
jgi:tetratricopeptide (TPR) repeat protein